MIILLVFAFISGLLTIFAPCIWPLLPIILSSTATGGHRKPLGITLGIMLSFGIFTLVISYLVKIIPFDPNSLRLFAVVVIGFLGVTLVIPKLSQILEGYVSRFSGKLGGISNNQENGLPNSNQGFWSGFITGCALGLVWTPCAGPILATIATLAATTAVNFQIVLVTIAYIIGVGIPLFIFATLGRTFFTKTRALSPYTGRIQQIFGVIMILTAILIYTNYDKVLQAKLLDLFPGYAQFVVDLESNDAVKKELDLIRNPLRNPQEQSVLLENEGQAPEFVGITNWIQSNPLTMEELRGKVVLVDFWTYTCINCIRTLPYLTNWWDKYKDEGLVIVGVHTPEFEFEKNTANVEQAIKQFGIQYPVAQDNNFDTWRAYDNHYWPAKYIIDKNGVIRYHHFGEGKYEETEKVIQELLKETGSTISGDLLELEEQTPRTPLTPEIYLGSLRMQNYFPSFSGKIGNETKTFTLSEDVPKNAFSLGGDWTITNEYAISGKNSVLVLNFTSQKVFLVMRNSPSSNPGIVKVFLDGKLVAENNKGVDVIDSTVSVTTDRLYELLNIEQGVGNHILRLEFQNSGIESYAFTFG